MAKSTGYYGLRRGSTKSHTYQVVNGKQITKDRQEGGKQPRTLAQMKQRCIIATAGSAYAALKSICDHSYEGVSAGLDSMSHFHKVNDSLLRQSALRDNGLFGYNKWGVKGLVAGSYVIAEGTLPQNCPNLQALSVDAVSRKCTIDVAYGRSVAEIAEELGVVNFGDIATIAMIYPKRDGSYGFGAVRLTYKQGEDVAGRKYELCNREPHRRGADRLRLEGRSRRRRVLHGSHPLTLHERQVVSQQGSVRRDGRSSFVRRCYRYLSRRSASIPQRQRKRGAFCQPIHSKRPDPCDPIYRLILARHLEDGYGCGNRERRR